MSIKREIGKENVAHTYKGILSHNNKETMPFEATCMQPEIIILSEVNQKEKNKYHT